MKQLNIPFKLGKQYENWEFDLEVLPDRMRVYDSYIYLGEKFNNFLNYSKFKTELIFNLEILEVVIISFENKDLRFYQKLNKRISTHLIKPDFELKDNYIIKNYVALNLELWCCYLHGIIYVILGECCLIECVINTLM